jgi:hypothetical protein
VKIKKPKEFDAVEMKNRVQAQLREEQKGLSDEEIRHRRRVWPETSDDPLARWWRSIDRTPPNS